MKLNAGAGKQLLLDNCIWFAWSVLYALCFPTYNLSYGIWFIFAPVLAFAYVRPIQLTVRYAFFYSIPNIFLAFFWLYGFWGPGLLFVIPIYSVYYAFFFLCIAIVAKKMEGLRWLIIPCLWISNELLRSLGYHGFMWNMIGDTQWKNLLFIQGADVFGVWGISFVILLVNSVIAELVVSYLKKGDLKTVFNRQNIIKTSVAAGLVLMNLVYGIIQLGHYQKISDSSPKERLALIQPNIGSHEAWWKNRWQHYATIWQLNAEAAVKSPDMIVWSETMVRNYVWYYLMNYSPEEEVNVFNIRFVKMPSEFGVPILFTSPTFVNGKNYNSGEYLDPDTNVVQNNSKIHLVPFGEWMPFYDRIPVFKKIMESEGAGSYTPSTNLSVIKGRKSKFRVLVCYEDVFAILARKFVRKGVNYFINTTNDGWAYLLGLPHPMFQHLAGAVMTAVTVRRPIARAANTGVTGIIDLTGEFKGDIGSYGKGFYVGDISIIDEKIESPYVKFGFVFPYILSLVALAAFVYSVFFGKEPDEKTAKK